MNAEPKDIAGQPEDIDLLLLVERSILFFRKYRWVFIIAILLGFGLGFFFYRIIPKTYKSRLIVHSFTLANEEEIMIVYNWNELLKKKEYASLTTLFNCRDELLGKLKQIKAREIQQVFTPSNPNGFTIDVVVTDNSILDSLQSGIVYAFEHNQYIRNRLEVRKDNLRELIDKTNSEIRKLDSTKKLFENIIGGKGKSSASLIVDGSSINRQWIDMNEKLLGFKAELQFTSAVQVLQSFSKFHRPAGPNLIPWLVIGLFLFLSLAYVFALISSIKERLRIRSEYRDHP